MSIKRTVAALTIFILFVLTGGAWLSLARYLPDGVSRNVVIIVFGVGFVATFLWLLFRQIRSVLAGSKNLKIELAIVVMNLTLLIMAFAWMYQMLEIRSSTSGAPENVDSFSVCVYYSIVTFTTLGYGDLIPVGVARVLAALEAFTGYIVLGVLASTAASILAPEEQPGQIDPEEID